MAEKKTLKMYTTGAGAKQYGSKEDIRKHADKAFRRFLANPTDKTLSELNKFDAADYAAVAKEFRDKYGERAGDLDDFFEKRKVKASIEAKVRSLLKAKK